MTNQTRTEPLDRLAEPLTDSDKLLVLAAWFDMWDRPETDRQAILDDERSPGRNDVQRDLRRIAAELDAEAREAARLRSALDEIRTWVGKQRATSVTGRCSRPSSFSPDSRWLHRRSARRIGAGIRQGIRPRWRAVVLAPPW